MKEGQIGLVRFGGQAVTWHGPARTAHWPVEAPGTAPGAGHLLPAAPAGALGQIGDPTGIIVVLDADWFTDGAALVA
jgi:hypothetical protein